VSDEVKAAPAADPKKTPRLASPEMLAEARAIEKNLTWDDLVRIASKPKYTGWIVWKTSGIVEQLALVQGNGWIVLARRWKTGLRHAIVRHPSDPADTTYKCVELDPETKRPVPA
jgi:hypothetical protein